MDENDERARAVYLTQKEEDVLVQILYFLTEEDGELHYTNGDGNFVPTPAGGLLLGYDGVLGRLNESIQVDWFTNFAYATQAESDDAYDNVQPPNPMTVEEYNARAQALKPKGQTGTVDNKFLGHEVLVTVRDSETASTYNGELKRMVGYVTDGFFSWELEIGNTILEVGGNTDEMFTIELI